MKSKTFEVVVRLALLLCLLLPGIAGANNIVTSPNEASLRAAIKIGGWVSLQFNGTITIANTIAISNNVILDGSGVAATISGGNAVRLFYVAPGVTFGATNLTLANGSCVVTNGTPADAGAIYNDGGTVTLTACTLTNNSAQSLVIPVNYYNFTRLARGGAIFNNGGVVLLNQSGISNNAAIGGGIGTGLGGALYNTNGTMTIMGCNVSSNVCQGLSVGHGTGLAMGGAIFQTSGSLTIADSNFAFNQALGGSSYFPGSPGHLPSSPAYGGAAAITGGGVTINHSQFFANTAKGGDAQVDYSFGGQYAAGGPAAGGAVYSAATLTVNDSSFLGNQTLSGNNTVVPDGALNGIDAYGGAIYNLGTASLNRCSVYSNYIQGGNTIGNGVYGYGSGLANGGNGLGGGIFNASQLAVTNCTIALNSAAGGNGSGDRTDANFNQFGSGGNAFGGGVFNNSSATFIAMNLTIASNTCSSPSSPYGAYFREGIAAGAEIANTNGTLRLHNSIIAYGGSSGNAYGPITDDGYNICSDGSANLSSGSSYNNTDPKLAPLADNGGLTWCMALLPTSAAIDSGDSAGSPNTDQRGFVRPIGAGPDIGAYEYGSYLLGSHPLVGPYLNITAIASDVLLSFTASPPSAYRLQASTNLTTWTDLITYGPFASPTNISQNISRLAFDRFYFRLLVQ